jgi:hypothetical protein
MSARSKAITPILLAVVVAIGVGAFLVGRSASWWRGTGGSYAPATIRVAATVEPDRVLFGDEVTARVKVLVNPRTIDPDSVSVTTDLRPYRIVATRPQKRQRVGKAVRLESMSTAACLTVACLGAIEHRGRVRVLPVFIRFRPVTVEAVTTTGERVEFHSRFQPLLVRSRLASEELMRLLPVVPANVPPEPTYRVAPDAAVIALVVVAIAAAFGGVYLIASAFGLDPLWRLRRTPRDTQTRLERAVEFALNALRVGDVAGSRRAVQGIADELDRMGATELGSRATGLAWSEPTPGASEVSALADEALRSQRDA